MKNKTLLVLLSILTLVFALAISANASTTCTHENKNVTAVEYTDYAQNGKLKFVCDNCDVTEMELEPLIIANGYSISDDGTGLCAGYTVNNKALTEIMKLNDKFELGLVAGSKSLLGDKMPLDSKTATPVDLSQYGARVIKATISNENCSSVDIKLIGFDGGKYYSQLYLSAFAFDGEAVKYVQGEKQAESLSPLCYLEATGETEVKIDGYSYSLIKDTKDADNRLLQMDYSKSTYNKGSSMASWKILVVQGEAYAIVAGGAMLEYTNAAKFLSHYLGNSGLQYNLDLVEFFKDGNALKVRNKDINRALRAGEKLAIEGASVNVNQTMEQVNHDLSGDWYYSLGSYFSRINMSNLTVTEVDGVKTYSATLKYTVTDYYNWNEGSTNGFLNGSGPSQYQLYQLHRAGKAQEFLTVGEISYEITWTEGQTVDQISGLN